MSKKHKSAPDGYLIKRRRDGDKHIKACKSGYFKTKKSFRQIHHILPVTSLSDGTIAQFVKDKKQREFIGNCFAVTDWDINAAPNNIGLPLKRAFMDKRAPGGWDGHPCHQVDHPTYTKEVCEALKKNIWDPAYKASKECKFEATDLVGALNDESDAWRAELLARGKRPDGKGTKHAWDNRHKMKNNWFEGFSMAATPTKRNPPPKMEDFSGNIQEYLKHLFSQRK